VGTSAVGLGFRAFSLRSSGAVHRTLYIAKRSVRQLMPRLGYGHVIRCGCATPAYSSEPVTASRTRNCTGFPSFPSAKDFVSYCRREPPVDLEPPRNSEAGSSLVYDWAGSRCCRPRTSGTSRARDGVWSPLRRTAPRSKAAASRGSTFTFRRVLSRHTLAYPLAPNFSNGVRPPARAREERCAPRIAQSPSSAATLKDSASTRS
jgi:hypothetical protein